jgi:carbon monoxide dehydrogenase subunit G
MSIEIREQFEVERSRSEVWDFLVDPARVVRCLPGARLVEVVDERTFRGEVGVRLGPFSAAFTGTIHFDILDRDNHRVAMG